ncbi:sugar transferase [uncultured Roseobacter sp.]|uniref:sugar transferase n=1 Tax=uncultured Roseobacter sp. TaxID=114847 RepID=UPI00260AC226|nr:sugar transferase [uncultured Roseobacter sp.]
MTDDKIDAPTFGDLLMRLADLLICMLFLPVTLLVLCVVTIAIKLDDAGPVFFRQTRVGRGTEPFPMLKFRTMYADPARVSGDATSTDDLAAERARFQTASANDPRITRVGRFLRKTHLDELPQILNVLKGDMSMVGVRPDVPVQRADYTAEEWHLRHVLRPGITGLAQIDPRANGIPGVRTERDLEWVRRRSFALYLSILVGTFRKVLNRSGV